jgi:hypothetical protein
MKTIDKTQDSLIKILKKFSGIQSFSLDYEGSKPYFIIFINERRFNRLSKKLPQQIDGIDIIFRRVKTTRFLNRVINKIKSIRWIILKNLTNL